MNELQKKELEILLEIDRVCKENNIKYFLSSGTMLGAVRHNGFIPWDDDVDIIMPIEEYWKFSSVAQSALRKDFFFQSTDTDLWYRAYSKVRYNNTTMIETSYNNIGFHQGVWVDIFPIIGIPDNQRDIEKINKAIIISDLLLQDAFYKNQTNVPLKIKILFKIPLSLRRKICKTIRKFVFKPLNQYNHCDYYWGFPFKKPRFLPKHFDEAIPYTYEGHILPIPKMYDEILTNIYGDYMTPPPPEHRNGGHSIDILDLENDYTSYIKDNL
ncbi:MAG: LicD family protein [Clostridia bacterium]|nr:LicD family protein [Clostridia bacterium]